MSKSSFRDLLQLLDDLLCKTSARLRDLDLPRADDETLLGGRRFIELELAVKSHELSVGHSVTFAGLTLLALVLDFTGSLVFTMALLSPFDDDGLTDLISLLSLSESVCFDFSGCSFFINVEGLRERTLNRLFGGIPYLLFNL